MGRLKRRTIGDNPLDALIPRAGPEGSALVDEEPPKVAKQRMTFILPVDVIDRVKNAAYWTPGLTLADLAAQALTEAVDRLERKRGEPFPPRKSTLKGGRPMK
jgi:hypothetical protein